MFANPLLSKQHHALLPELKLLRKVKYEMYGMAPQETHENCLYTVVLFLLISFTAVPISSEDGTQSMKTKRTSSSFYHHRQSKYPITLKRCSTWARMAPLLKNSSRFSE